MKYLLSLVFLCSFIPNEVAANEYDFSDDCSENSNNNQSLSDASDILNDVLNLVDEIFSKDASLVKTKTDKLISMVEKGTDVDILDFYKRELGISPSLVSKIKNYSASKIQLITYEVDNPESDGLLYQEYLSNKGSYDSQASWKRASGSSSNKQCAPECCGGWRPIFVLIAVEACVLRPTPAGCAGAAYGVASMVADGCFS